MSDLPKIGGTKHKTILRLANNHLSEMWRATLCVDNWIKEQVQDPPRTKKEWQAAGYTLQQLIMTLQGLIRQLEARNREMEKIINDQQRKNSNH